MNMSVKSVYILTSRINRPENWAWLEKEIFLVNLKVGTFIFKNYTISLWRYGHRVIYVKKAFIKHPLCATDHAIANDF